MAALDQGRLYETCGALPKALAAKKPPIWSRILGAYWHWHEERVIFIDHDQPEPRQFWTDAHEATHVMCPWHAEVLRLDNEDTLFKRLYAAELLGD